VRECPVKAIKIIDGQAEVIHERCIACGNCVKVCSQHAKYYQKATDQVFDLLKSDQKTVAIIAPSFPAEFSDYEHPDVLVGMIRKLGFDYVNEVAFGADMVARKYNEIIKDNGTPRISSDCPAIVYYVRHYHPGLISNLAPVASPMVATARIMRKKHGQDIKIVFIGPCIAKKAESEEIDLAITFTELRSRF
jgi:iron only hydrogenase large subunit-like protein